MRDATVHLWPEGTIDKGDQIIHHTTVEVTGKRYNLWYSYPPEWAPCVSTTMDSQMIASVFFAMRHGDRLVAHGPVSKELLKNLDRFQDVWGFWRRDLYHKVDLVAKEELEATAPVNDKALIGFSGGVDSCFTLHRHLQGLCGRQTEKIGAALMIHGFDVPLEMREAFATASESAQNLLEPRGVPLIRLATNWRQIMRDLQITWEDGHGSGLISCLSLFQNGFGRGLLASTLEYLPLIAWGSSPLTDPLLSSDRFPVVHDGAHVPRPRKLPMLATWPEALDHMRVCWERPELAGNCCECEKCIRTMLCFRVNGMELPASFPRDVSDRQIERLTLANSVAHHEFSLVRQEAIAAGMENESWVRALTRAMDRFGRPESPIMALRRRLKLRTRVKSFLGIKVPA
jgi:hypothetical protein